MAKIIVSAAAAAAASAVVVLLLTCCCCASFAAGQDIMDDESSDDSLSSSGRPLSLADMAAAYSTLAAPGGRKPNAVSNIQKVSRTAKAIDGTSAMMAMLAADNGTAAASQPSDLEWLLNVYNPHRWNPVKLPAASRLSVQCRDVMKLYLEALRQGSFWAAKSECHLLVFSLKRKKK